MRIPQRFFPGVWVFCLLAWGGAATARATEVDAREGIARRPPAQPSENKSPMPEAAESRPTGEGTPASPAPPSVAPAAPSPAGGPGPGSAPSANEPGPPPVALERLGGEVVISAGRQERLEGGLVLLEDYVAIVSPNGSLHADRVEYDPVSGTCLASGNVVMEGQETKVSGARAEWNLATGLGTVWDATVLSSDDVTMVAARVERAAPDLYILHDATLTSCLQALPVWSVHFSTGKFREDRFARLWNARISFKKAPVAYSPFLIFPIRKERTSGFLMPQVAYSDRRGISVTNAFFWAISRNADATFEFDWREKTGWALSSEFRYLGTGDSRGELNAHYTEEEDEDAWGNTTPSRRLEVLYDHQQRFGEGWRWLVNVNYLSDFSLTQDLGSASLDSTSRNDTVSNTSVTKTAPTYSLTFLAERQEHLFDTTTGERTSVSSNLPRAKITSGARRLGRGPFFFSYEASADHFDQQKPLATGDFDASWQRLYGAASLRVPLLEKVPWMDVTPRVGVREAIYSKRLGEIGTGETESGAFDYTAPLFELEVAGPRLQRFYGIDHAPGKTKSKQLIEPRAVWTYEPDLDDQRKILVYDGTDSSFSRPIDPDDPTRDLDRNLVTYGVVTRLWSKPVEEPGTASRTSSREVLSWELRQSYSVNYEQNRALLPERETSRLSDISSTVRWRPAREANLQLDTGWDWLFDTVSFWRISGDWNYGSDRVLSVSWDRRRPVRSSYEASQVRLRWGTRFWRERFHWDMDLAYDFEESLFRGQRYVFEYRNQCCGVALQYFRNEFSAGDVDQEIRFTVSLKNAGTFVNFHSRGL